MKNGSCNLTKIKCAVMHTRHSNTNFNNELKGVELRRTKLEVRPGSMNSMIPNQLNK